MRNVGESPRAQGTVKSLRRISQTRAVSIRSDVSLPAPGAHSLYRVTARERAVSPHIAFRDDVIAGRWQMPAARCFYVRRGSPAFNPAAKPFIYLSII